MASIQGKRMIPIYLEESIYREIKVYGAETDQSFQQVISEQSHEFEQSLIKLVSRIKEMKRKAEEERQKQEEIQRIADENPLPVPGHEVNPITNDPIPA